MNTNTFYPKSHSYLPRVIEKLASASARNEAGAIIALPPERVDKQMIF